MVIAAAACSAAVTAFAVAAVGNGTDNAAEALQTACEPVSETETLDTPDIAETFDPVERTGSDMAAEVTQTKDFPNSDSASDNADQKSSDTKQKNIGDTDSADTSDKKDTSTDKTASASSDSDMKRNASKESDSDKKDSDSKNDTSKSIDSDLKSSDTNPKNSSDTDSADTSKNKDTSTDNTTSASSDSDMKRNASKESDSDKKDTDSKNDTSKSSDSDLKSSDTNPKNSSDTDSADTSDKKDTSTDKTTSTSSDSDVKNDSSKNSDTDQKDSDSSKDKNGSDTDSKNKNNSDSDKTESKSETKYPPKKYQIDVEHFTQLGVLPTGCEIISTKMVLNYYGKEEIEVNDLLSNLPRDSLKFSKDGKLYGKTPFQAFIGDPKVKSGFGCYPPVIMQMIENYDYPDLYTEDTSGLPLDFVAKTYITQDIPVLVWVTIGMGQSYLTSSWYVSDSDGNITKEKYTWRANEHCMVLIGYDEKSYYFCDPLSYKDVVKFDKSLVEKRYKEVGSYSMLIRQYEEYEENEEKDE